MLQPSFSDNNKEEGFFWMKQKEVQLIKLKIECRSIREEKNV